MVVTTPYGESPNTGSDDYAYVDVNPPTVIGVDPNSGPTTGGTEVTITGTNFAGITTVAFGGADGTGVNVSLDGTQLRVIAPAHDAGLVDVVVTSIGGTATSTGAYTYEVPGQTTID